MLFTKEDRNLSMFSKMLQLSGLWFYYDVSPRTKLISMIRAYIVQLINILLQISSFRFGFKKLYLENKSGSYFLSMIIIHLQLVMFLKNNYILNQFVDGMRGILKKRGQDWEMKIFDQYCSKSWKFINFEFTILILFWFLFIICPTVIDIFFLAFYESSEPFYLDIFFIGFIPEKNERSLLLYTALFLTYCQSIAVGLYMICMFCILVSSVAYMCAELRIIGTRLQLWSKDHGNPNRDLVLRQIIQEHNDILALIYSMKKYIGELYLSQNVIVPIALTVCLFSLTKALKAGDVNLVIGATYVLLGWLSFPFISCYFSQNLYDESVRLSETFYEIEWENETPGVRKTLWVMMMATKKPIVLDFKGIIPMNLERFGEVINLSYSYFTILQSLA